jgi:hypothetical protein
MSAKLFLMIAAALAALVGGAYVTHHPGAMRSMHSIVRSFGH